VTSQDGMQGPNATQDSGQEAAMDAMSAHARTPQDGQRRAPQMKAWQLWGLIGFVALSVLALAVFSAASSYESLRSGAEAHHVPLPDLNPASFDYGLFVVLVVNICLIALRQPVWWVRWVARLLAALTIAGNVAAGWPDPIGIGYRIAAPVIIITLMEIGQTLLLRRYKRDDPYLAEKRRLRQERKADRIPLSRWVLDYGNTWALYKRMKLWGITSYRDAIDMEQRRLRAMRELAEHFGTASWRSLAPGDLVWMLDTGIHMDDALKRAAELIAAARTGDRRQDRPQDRRQDRRRNPGRTGRGPGQDDDVSVEARALAFLDQDTTMTAPDLRAKLAEAGVKISDGYARKLVRKLTAQDRVTASPQDRSQDRAAGRPE
jgi:hypothetical protein